MVDAAPLLLNVPADRAREVVAATLSEQGFDVRRCGGILEVERDAHSVDADGVASRVTFLVRVDAMAGGSVAHFGEAGGSAVATAAARVARARLAERGLVAEEATDAAPTLPREVATGAEEPSSAGRVTPASGYALPGGVAAASRRAADPPVSIVATLAFVLGFVAPVGGIVAGVFALGILRRTRERGRGLAVAGIAVGGALTVLTVAVVIASVSWLVGGSTSSTAVTVPSSSSAARASPPSETPGSAFEPRVGQCFVQRGRGEVGDASIVDCATPHSYELYARFPVAGGTDDYPGDDEVAHSAEAGCVEAFGGFVGLAYDRSALDYVYTSPTRKTWALGDRSVSCLVTDPAGPVTATLRDAAR